MMRVTERQAGSRAGAGHRRLVVVVVAVFFVCKFGAQRDQFQKTRQIIEDFLFCLQSELRDRDRDKQKEEWEGDKALKLNNVTRKNEKEKQAQLPHHNSLIALSMSGSGEDESRRVIQSRDQSAKVWRGITAGNPYTHTHTHTPTHSYIHVFWVYILNFINTNSDIQAHLTPKIPMLEIHVLWVVKKKKKRK